MGKAALSALAMAIGTLGLAGCNSETDGSSGASASSGPAQREPGSWKTDVKLLKVEIPGMPAGMKEGMEKMMASASGMETCLTEEQAKKEDIAKELSKGSNTGECTFSKRNVSGGNIDIAGSCKAGEGRVMNVAMKGTMDSKKSDVTITSSGQAPNGQGTMEMVMQVTSTHVGPCKGA